MILQITAAADRSVTATRKPDLSRDKCHLETPGSTRAMVPNLQQVILATQLLFLPMRTTRIILQQTLIHHKLRLTGIPRKLATAAVFQMLTLNLDRRLITAILKQGRIQVLQLLRTVHTRPGILVPMSRTHWSATKASHSIPQRAPPGYYLASDGRCEYSPDCSMS